MTRSLTRSLSEQIRKKPSIPKFQIKESLTVQSISNQEPDGTVSSSNNNAAANQNCETDKTVEDVMTKSTSYEEKGKRPISEEDDEEETNNPNSHTFELYESPESAAYAYDCAAYKLRGEYARLNFNNLKDSTAIIGIGDSKRMDDVKNAVDLKIQAICQKLKRERANKIAKKKLQESCSKNNEKLIEEIVSPNVYEEEFWKSNGYCNSGSSDSTSYSDDFGNEECSLEKMPSFDPELIWQFLAD